MNPECRKLRKILIEQGLDALRDSKAAEEHIGQCGECFALLEAAADLEIGFQSLQPVDAPDETVARLLEAVANASPPAARHAPTPSWRERWQSQWTTATRSARLRVAALAALLVVAVLALYPRWRNSQPSGDALAYIESTSHETVDRKDSAPISALGYISDDSSRKEAGEQSDVLEEAEVAQIVGGQPKVEPEDRFEPKARRGQAPEKVDGKRRPPPAPIAMRPIPDPAPGVPAGTLDEASTLEAVQVQSGVEADAPIFVGTSTNLVLEDKREGASNEEQAMEVEELRHRLQQMPPGLSKRAGRLASTPNAPPPTPAEPSLSAAESNADIGEKNQLFLQDAAEISKNKTDDALVAQTQLDLTPAYRFLEQVHSTEGLSFRPSQGYWANTYLPGDPALRRLSEGLAHLDRTRLEALIAQPIALHDAARRNPQPFDPPQRSALSLYLQSDHRRVEGPTRLLLQVGLQATERQAGRRGAMHLGVILHLDRSLDAEEAKSLQALFDALAQARSAGDRFELWSSAKADDPKTPLVDADSFRFGTLHVALSSLLRAQTAHRPEPSNALEAVFESAMAQTSGADDPQAPLGSSALLLVTASSLGEQVGALERLAHLSAVAGLPVSVVGLGSLAAGDPSLDRIALAGQGSRRFLTSASEASALVDGELAAASRAVARAVRLRIRLAPEVQLVDVLGSHPLNAAAASRVREAEKSLDLRLARSLGIEADRGEDEEGIQIVIPAFYAGDAHVILLDLLVPGPGPVADVRVRYKDLAFLRNATTRAQLTVERGASAPGPLETRVFENRIAFEVQQRLDAAGHQLHTGLAKAALEQIRALELLLQALPQAVPTLRRSELLREDVGMVREYRRLLEAGAGEDRETRLELADSLRLAAALRLQPPPRPLDP